MNQDEKIKVLLIGPKLPIGGRGRFVDDFFEANPPFELFLYDIQRSLKKQIKSYRINSYQTIFNAGIKRLVNSAVITMTNIVRFPNHFRKINPEVVYFSTGGYFNFWDICPYIFYMRKKSKKIILHWLGPLEPFYFRSSAIVKYLIRQVLNNASISIVLTKKDKLLISRLAPGKKLYYIPSSVRLEKFIQAKPSFPINVEKECFKILFLGSLDPFRKGLPTLLEAFSLVLSSTRKNVLLLVSGGDSCLRLLNELPTSVMQKVTFLSLINEQDKASLFKSCDLMVLPSHDEGMPYTLVESMAASLPIIASNIGGIPDIVHDGENGFLLSPGQPQQLAEKILILINNPDLCNEFGRKSLELAQKNHSLDQMFKSIFELCLAHNDQ